MLGSGYIGIYREYIGVEGLWGLGFRACSGILGLYWDHGLYGDI